MALERRTEIFAQYDALCAIADPETNPYDSKYKARGILTAYLRDVEHEDIAEIGEQADLRKFTVGCIKSRLGSNYLQTEENAHAEAPLLECVDIAKWFLEPVLPPAAPPTITLSPAQLSDIVAASIESCNFLSLLYSGWDKHAKSLKFLRQAKRHYRIVKAKSVGMAAETRGLSTVDALFTHTLFYYAQIYNKLEQNSVSSRYVEATLRRQLQEQEAFRALRKGSLPDADIAHANALQHATGPDWKPSNSDVSSSEDVYVPPSASIDRSEWVRNAIRLTDYYVVRRRWTDATQCLAAGDIVLHSIAEDHVAAARSDDAEKMLPIDWKALPESLQRLLAESALAWAKLYLTVIRVARDKDFAPPPEEEAVQDVTNPVEAGGDDPFSTAPGAGLLTAPASDRPSKSGNRRIAGVGGDAVDLDDSDHEGDVTLATVPTPHSVVGAAPFAPFVTAHLGEIIRLPFYGPSVVAAATCRGRVLSSISKFPEPQSVTSFEDAKPLFMAAQTCLLRALEFFVLDGFVTDHIVVLSYYSKAYKYLAYFETDSKREAAMHSRRIDMLAPILREINPSIYLQQHKEISLELASAAQDTFEIREARAHDRIKSEGGALKKAEVAAINDLVDKAISFYVHFLRCYKDPRLEKAPITADNSSIPSLDGASTLDDGSVIAYLTAHFCIARLLSRRVDTDKTKKLADLQHALGRFEWLNSNAAKLLPEDPSGESFGNELYMCREMVSLLPEKIRLVSLGAM